MVTDELMTCAWVRGLNVKAKVGTLVIYCLKFEKQPSHYGHFGRMALGAPLEHRLDQ